jgi:protein-S-isoprenylcysteine O-methyltransferase Ste14
VGVDGIGPVLLLVTAVTWFVLELRGLRTRRDDADDRDRGSMLVLRVSTVAAFVLAALVAYAVPGAAYPRVLAYALALTLLWLGIAIRWRSRAALGRYFTYRVRTSTDQPVVTSGPYRWVRHPAYLGMALALLGFACVLGNWLSLLVFVPVMLVGVVYRIRVEEAALLAAVGDDYAAYCRGRARLVPGVW